ncbi:uracil-DNA glycosylase [Paraferrimonas sp. SM1919]|uniref:uracil-DNA glycosylase n=1 Tax=Paraferrimonas sp. SM1919 TaxID=2662263 RepID=UPI0013D2E915|nr:uracil-DNA glycosylase [Paraferrimonas sp. SM1919]
MDKHWESLLAPLMALQPYQRALAYSQQRRAAGVEVYPPESQILNAFDACPLDKLKVVILGQDPYHGEGQAHGLSFSVQAGVKTPPSLVNMYKELATDISDFSIPNHGNLQAWAEQGVLLLNSVLTVEKASPNSHKDIGWSQFTDSVIKAISDSQHNVVFVLWGGFAKKKAKLIDASKHLVLTGPHPSPLSAYRGFFGCQHFSKINDYLAEHNQPIVDWQN